MNAGIGRDPIPGLTRLTPDTTRLLICNGPGANRSFALDQSRLVLGRSDPPKVVVDINLEECELGDPPMVSRRHAELQWVDGELQIIDLGSTNGTFVDGQPLQPLQDRQPSDPVTLKIGSKIRLGNLDMEVIRHE